MKSFGRKHLRMRIFHKNKDSKLKKSKQKINLFLPAMKNNVKFILGLYYAPNISTTQ